MKKNFTIDQSVGLLCGERYFDLHNCYDFDGFGFELNDRIFFIDFIKAVQSDDLPNKVSLRFYSINALELSAGFVPGVTRNICELGYKSQNDRDHDWLVGEDGASSDDHLFFRFEADHYIRVHGLSATVEYQ